MSYTKHIIGILVLPQVQLLDIAGPSDVFNTVNQLRQLQDITTDLHYEIKLISATKNKKIQTNSGFELNCHHTIYDLHLEIDTLLVTGSEQDLIGDYSKQTLHWLKGIVPTLKRMGSICIGVFLLAKVGVLDKRQVTTHWKYAALLKKTYPTIQLQYDQIFVKDHNIYTSGGITSGVNLALALVEEDCGRKVAAEVSRYLVVGLKRATDQRLYDNLIPIEIEMSPLVKSVQSYILRNLKETTIHNSDLADIHHMSERNFSRVFKKEAGMSPGIFHDKIRVEQAKRLLEETNLQINEIAEQVGFSTDSLFRKAFLKYVSTTPTNYRLYFKTTGLQ